MDRVCFGRSGIHGWGLFAKRIIQDGEMVRKESPSLNVGLVLFWDESE